MYPLRSHVGDIVFECIINPLRNICLILLDWLPSSQPSKKQVMQKLYDLWYSVITPRYAGTRESTWSFLDHPPANDVIALINYCKQDTIYDYYNKTNHDISMMKFCLVGVSFGGIIALDIMQKTDLCSYSLLISPVTSLAQHNHRWDEQDLIWLYDFIHHGFGHAYRVTQSDWNKMCTWDLFDSDITLLQEKKNNIWLIHGSNDTHVALSSVECFARDVGINEVHIIDNWWHLSFSKRDNDIYSVIDKILTNHYTLSVGTICFDSLDFKKVLCVQHNDSRRWLPKWLSEDGETREQTLKRECNEEIWTDEFNILDNINPYIVNYMVSFDGTHQEKTTIYFPSVIEKSTSITIDNNEIVGYKRVPIDNLYQYLSYPDIITYINQIAFSL